MFDKTLAIIRSVFSFVYVGIIAVFASPVVSKYLTNVFFKFWQGFSRLINPDVVPYLLKAKNTREVLVRSVDTNIRTMAVYAGLWLLYDAIIRGISRYAMPNVEGSFIEYGMDTAVRVLLFSLVLRNFLDNAMLTTAIIQAGKRDNPEGKHVCDHPTTQRILGMLEGELYYGANVGVVRGAEYVMPRLLPSIVSVPGSIVLRSFLYGRRVVDRGHLGEMCTDDRNKILNQNAYTFGIGLSFVMTSALLEWLLARYLGLKDDYRLNSALTSLLLQYFYMLSSAYDVVLPSRGEEGIDLGYPVRYAVTEAGPKLGKVLQPYLVVEGPGVNFAMVNRALNHYAARWMQQVIFGADWSSKKMFLVRPIPLLVTSLYRQDEVEASLEKFKAWAYDIKLKRRVVIVATYIEGGLSWAAELFKMDKPVLVKSYEKWVVEYVSDPKFDKNLKEFEGYLKYVYEQQAQYNNSYAFTLEKQRLAAITFVDSVPMTAPQPASLSAASAAVVDLPVSSQALPLPASQQPAPAVSEPLVTLAMQASVASTVTVPAVIASPDAQQSFMPDVGLVHCKPNVVAERTMTSVATTLKAIAQLERWKSEGYFLLGTIVPDGVTILRKTNADIQDLYNAIRLKLDDNVTRTGKTTQFYRLIKQCFERRHDVDACFQLIEKFAADLQLTIAEYRSIGVPPQLQSNALSLRR